MHRTFGAPVAFGLAAISMQLVAVQQAYAQTGSATQSYRINPADEVEIYVWGEERLQRVVRVLPDGTFAFPLVGQVKAQGLLPTELEKVITNGLSSQYRGEVPQVTVSVRVPSGYQYAVVGRVNSPGSFSPGRYVNLLDAIALAGGGSEFANLDNIAIIRKTPEGLRAFRFRLGGVMKGNIGDRELAEGAIPTIQTGDTVIVP